jgi:hypothetical protein
MEEEEEYQLPDAFKKVMAEGKCCICESPLKGSHPNLVNIDKVATWKFPVWGNILLQEKWQRALGMVCDNCVNVETGTIIGSVKLAIEIGSVDGEDYFRYHDITELEDVEPITSERISRHQMRQALQQEADSQREILWDMFSAVMPGAPSRGRIAYRGPLAEEINAELLRNSHYYLALINRGFIMGIRDPHDSQHNDFLTQFEIARALKKPTIVIFDIAVPMSDREWLKEVHMKGINVVDWVEADFTKRDDSLKKKLEVALKKLPEVA